VSAEPALLSIDDDPRLHSAALGILKERRQLNDASAVSQSMYDDALSEARRRRSDGGKPYSADDDGTDPILAEVRREFRSEHADFDEASALDHLRAVTVLAASQKKVDESNYLACLHAVNANTARSTSNAELDKHLEAAEALSDLAEARLAERRDFPSASGYEARYIAEVAALGRRFGIHYGERA
jgi:hypothetical protein